MYLWNHWFSKIPPKNLIDFSPGRFNISKYLVYKIFLGWNLSNFSVVFWKIDGFIKYILTLSDLYFLDLQFLMTFLQVFLILTSFITLISDGIGSVTIFTIVSIRVPIKKISIPDLRIKTLKKITILLILKRGLTIL